MNRTDSKFWFSNEYLHDILNCIKNDYYLLTVNNHALLPYKTTYYDTHNNDMYVAHHNGKLNRYKIRRRSYIISGISFLEVKFKNNKGRTIKNRIQTKTSNHHFSKKEAEFIRAHSPFTCEELTPSLKNKFNRITLVAKNFNERCTIDTNLHFEMSDNDVDLENLAVLEIKAEGRLDNSPLETVLKNHGIRLSSFSKYCIGRTIIDPYIKKNAFKKKLRSIEKVLHA